MDTYNSYNPSVDTFTAADYKCCISDLYAQWAKYSVYQEIQKVTNEVYSNYKFTIKGE